MMANAGNDTGLDKQLREHVEVLTGTRRGDLVVRGDQAVRINDLKGLISLAPSLVSTQAAGATPTAAEFDALVRDVHTLQEHLIAVATALQLKLNPGSGVR